jgi:hypothetical protein
MKRYWVSGGVAPHNLNLGTKLVVSFMSKPLYPQGRSPHQYPLDRRVSGPQSQWQREKSPISAPAGN